MDRLPHRYDTDDDFAVSRPVHVVWEITLACTLKCGHCGSRAGQRRPNELTTAECLDVIRQCARLGTREITLIGGEAFLRPDWIDLIAAISAHGMHCSMQSGGLGLTREKVRLAKEAGLRSAGVSIDGLRDVHDRLRGVAGSYDRALAALGHLREFDIPFSVNTQITALAVPQLRELMHVVAATGAKNWQVQLTVAMGNAADHPEILLQPYQLLELMPLLASLHEEALDRGMLLQPGNNIGYFGPYEHRWRVTTDDRHWEGCAAGHTGLGIEADGTIKGCPSLATGPYAGGNVRTMTIEEIWNTAAQLRFARDRGTDELWGFCGSCYYADVCRGGCTWMAHSLFDRAGNNPYCHYRVLELAKAGLRERVEQVVAAPGESFDNGRFDLILEPLGGGEGERIAPPPALVRERPRRAENRIPQRLPLCRACEQFVRAEETRCPHCGCDLAEAQAAYDAVLPEILDATAALERLLADARRTSAG